MAVNSTTGQRFYRTVKEVTGESDNNIRGKNMRYEGGRVERKYTRGKEYRRPGYRVNKRK